MNREKKRFWPAISDQSTTDEQNPPNLLTDFAVRRIRNVWQACFRRGKALAVVRDSDRFDLVLEANIKHEWNIPGLSWCREFTKSTPDTVVMIDQRSNRRFDFCDSDGPCGGPGAF